MEKTARENSGAAIKSGARRILSGRYAGAASAVLTAVLMPAGALALYRAFSSLYRSYLGGENGAEALLSVLSYLYMALTVIALTPLFLGLYRFIIHLCEGKREALGQLFFYYSTLERYLFALRTSCKLLALNAVCWTPFFAAYLFLDRLSLFAAAPAIAEAWLWLLLALIAGVFLSLTACTGFYLLLYLVVRMPEISFARLCGISFYAMWGHKTRALLFQLEFIGWLILSAISFGIVFLFYFLPYWLIANAQLAAYIYEKEEVYKKYSLY